MTKSLMTILISLTAACGGSTKPADSTASGPGSAIPTSASDPVATCVEVMNKNRDCTTDFIPALVDIRAKYDNPQGVAEAVKADRDQVISQAFAEWAVDSKDDAIARQCATMGPTMADADLTTARGCVASAECGPYVTCISQLFDKQFAK